MSGSIVTVTDKVNLRGSTRELLWEVKESQGPSAGMLARRLKRKAASVKWNLNSLSDRGLVERKGDRWYATPRGDREAKKPEPVTETVTYPIPEPPPAAREQPEEERTDWKENAKAWKARHDEWQERYVRLAELVASKGGL